MPTELVLRPAVPDDVPALVAVMRAARAAAPMPDLPVTDREAMMGLAARLDLEEIWLAEAQPEGSGATDSPDLDGVLGYARFTATWLDDLYVDPAAQGSGVGSALLDLVKSMRPGGFCLWAFVENTPARAFYAGHGLVELEHTDGSENPEGAPDIRVAWPGERPLEFLRGLIDEVDDEIAGLLARRVALTSAVQRRKPVGGPAGRDAVREQEIVDRMVRRVPALGPERLGRIVDAVITESLDASR